MRRKRAAKIVSTLGPASSTPEKIAELFEAGADVFRLNFSHGSHEEHAARYAAIRDVEEKIGGDFCRVDLGHAGGFERETPAPLMEPCEMWACQALRPPPPVCQ